MLRDLRCRPLNASHALDLPVLRRWLLTNFDCCAMWFRERAHTINALRYCNTVLCLRVEFEELTSIALADVECCAMIESITPEYLRSKEYDAGYVRENTSAAAWQKLRD